MIYTVTLNPSIDYVLTLDSIKFGVTNRAKNEEYHLGGKGINVSAVLCELGVKSTALGFVAGFTGEEIKNGLKKANITSDFIMLKNGISRINVKIKSEAETEINAQGPHVDEAALSLFYEKTNMLCDGDILVLAGSVPESVPDDIYERIIQRLGNRDIKIVVDATKNLLLNTLKYKPFLIKPNQQEISDIFGVQVKTEKDVVKYALKLQKMGAKNVLVSLGADGALLLDETGVVHKGEAVSEKPINTVGSGDSMVAGFIAGYCEKADYSYALKLGSACGNATALSNGLAKAEKIADIMTMLESMQESE